MLVFILLALSLPLSAEMTPSSLLAQADHAYAQRVNTSDAKNALMLYQQALASEPANVEARWKASRAAWWLGDQSESRSDKLSYFQQAVEYAQAGVTLAPDSVESHFWLGCSYGSLGESQGVLKSLSLVKPIRREMAEVNRINDRFDGGAGYRVLGIVDYQVPGFAGGSKKRALEELQKALAIDPQNPFTRYYLAAYFKTVGDAKNMEDQWAALKDLKVPEWLTPEYQALLKKGQKAFEK